MLGINSTLPTKTNSKTEQDRIKAEQEAAHAAEQAPTTQRLNRPFRQLISVNDTTTLVCDYENETDGFALVELHQRTEGISPIHNIDDYTRREIKAGEDRKRKEQELPMKASTRPPQAAQTKSEDAKEQRNKPTAADICEALYQEELVKARRELAEVQELERSRILSKDHLRSLDNLWNSLRISYKSIEDDQRSEFARIEKEARKNAQKIKIAKILGDLRNSLRKRIEIEGDQGSEFARIEKEARENAQQIKIAESFELWAYSSIKSAKETYDKKKQEFATATAQKVAASPLKWKQALGILLGVSTVAGIIGSVNLKPKTT